MKTQETYLPVFTGFYGTHFEADETPEIDDINQHRRDKNLPEIEYKDCKFDYKEYHNNVAKQCTNYIEKELKDLNLIDKIEFQALYSPKEYNFSNDAININVHLTDDNIKEIRKILFDNLAEYKQYLINNYTSCSGFISFNPNTLEGWQEITKDFTDYSGKEHYLGSVLEFICSLNEINVENMLDSLTDVYISATNYNELIGE